MCLFLLFILGYAEHAFEVTEWKNLGSVRLSVYICIYRKHNDVKITRTTPMTEIKQINVF